MPVNDFEKKVQQKMDELQLRPSPEVWTEVEKHIRKDKRRRVLFFWLPLAALFLGGIATVWIIMSGSHNTTDNNNTIAGKQVVTTTDKNTENRNNTQTNTSTQQDSKQQPQSNITTTDNNAPQSSSINPTTSADDVSQKRQQPVTSISPNTNNNRVKPRLQQDADALITVQQANTRSQKRKTETNPPVVKQEETDLPPSITVIREKEEKQNVVKQDTKPETEMKQQETANVKQEEIVTRQTEQPKTDSSVNVVTTDKKEETPVTTETANSKPRADKISRRKWQFGIELQTGGSNTEEGGLFKNMDKSLVYANPVQNTTGSFAAGPFAPPILVSSPNAGFSAGVKLHAERPLSRRLSFQGTIGYSYLSTTIDVGNRINVSRQITNDISRNVVVESFYNSSPAYGSASEYTNRFHLLGVSAGISWKFIDKKKLTMSWDNSISMNRLLATNALLFDRNLLGYYKDFNAYRKTQFFLTTALTVPVWHKNRFSIALRPFASYGFTPVLKTHSSSNSSSHFVQYGLGLKFSMLQKK